MLKPATLLRIFALVTITATFASGQTPGWTVKPEWVHAHEMFLASDAMRGRGSATPDEWIAAAYVASEFEKYGVKPGLPDGTYVQRIELVQPVVKDQVTIAPKKAGFTRLQQRKDFVVLRSRGQSDAGPLQKVGGDSGANEQVQPGAIILLEGALDLGQRTALIGRARQSGARTVLWVDPSLDSDRLNEHLSLTPRAAGVEKTPTGLDLNLIALTKQAGDRLAQLPDGTELSIHIATRDTTRYTYNAVGVLPGSDSGPGAKVVLLSAHLDHLGISEPVNGDSIYNGANDDASGTTAVLEIAHALAAGPKPKRTIYFVCYGSEELGGLGSTYFREHSPVPLDRIAANLVFEMIGNQDPKMSKGKMLFTGWERSNLGPALAQHGALLGDDPYPEKRFFERSDNYPLALKGVVAHTVAGWGAPPTYHKPDDDVAHLDFNFLTAAIQSLIEPVRWLADSDFVPQWTPGKQPEER